MDEDTVAAAAAVVTNAMVVVVLVVRLLFSLCVFLLYCFYCLNYLLFGLSSTPMPFRCSF